MAQLLSGGRIKQDNGQIVKAVNGAWYDGQRYLDGQLLRKNEYEPGKFTSAEVNAQSAKAQGKTTEEFMKYLGQSSSTPSSQPGGSPNSGSGSGSPLQQVNQAIQNSFETLQKEVMNKWGQYTAGKPFRVDEVLAAKTKEAGEQIDPYYNEILGDYLLGITTKINRSRDDTRDLLSELSSSTASYTEKSTNQLAKAVEQAQQGFADSGLFGSGASLRSEGEAKQLYGSDLADYTRKADFQGNQLRTGLNRTIEDINADKKGYVSNLEKNRYTDVSTRASQLTKEAGQDYIRGFQATLPTELQAASGFDMLRSLGIYS